MHLIAEGEIESSSGNHAIDTLVPLFNLKEKKMKGTTHCVHKHNHT